jgi:hypothetical protein
VGIFGARHLPVRDAVWLEPGQPVVLDSEGVSWNKVRLERLDALYIHGFRYEDPVLPPADPICDWSLWQAGAVIRQQSHSFLYSVFSWLEQRGGPRLYNPVSSELAAFDRPGQLDRLGQTGFAVPPMLIGNDDRTVAAFQQQHQGVVWRPMTGRAAWQWFQERQRQHLVGPDKPPVVLAAVCPGPLLRFYVLDGHVVLVLATAPPNREGIERLESLFPVTDLPPLVLETVGNAATALGLRWAVALAIHSPDGPIFYDVDPDPELGDLPPSFEAYLNHCLAAALVGEPLPVTSFEAEPVERSALLLRRMLAIQFDMEQSKYA